MTFQFDLSAVYRIQSIPFPDSFITIGDDNKTVGCMPYDFTNTKQQRRFSYIIPNEYYIQSIYNQYYFTRTSASSFIVHPQGTNSWITDPYSNVLYMGAVDLRNKTKCQTVTFNGKTISLKDDIPDSGCAWTLRPVTWAPAPAQLMLNVCRDTLPTGNYRIRSFDSKYFLTMSDAKSYVRRRLPGDIQRQMWSVTCDESSKLYTIQNSRTNQFLARSGIDGSLVIGQAGTCPWIIHAIDKGFMFIIGSAESQLLLGFSEYDAEGHDRVGLEPIANSPGQIWFFETAPQICKDEVHATRLLTEGQFTIRNCHDHKYLAILNHRLVEGQPTRWLAAMLTLRYIDNNSPIFTLRDGNGPWLVDSGGFLMARNSAVDHDKQWIALPHQSTTGVVYYICHPAQEHPLSALSGRQVDNDYVFEERVEGEVMQLWNFEQL